MFSFIIKLITFPFWFPAWVVKTSIKLAIGAALITAVGGYVYFAHIM